MVAYFSYSRWDGTQRLAIDSDELLDQPAARPRALGRPAGRRRTAAGGAAAARRAAGPVAPRRRLVGSISRPEPVLPRPAQPAALRRPVRRAGRSLGR